MLFAPHGRHLISSNLYPAVNAFAMHPNLRPLYTVLSHARPRRVRSINSRKSLGSVPLVDF